MRPAREVLVGGQSNDAASQRRRAVDRHRLSDEEEAWIARQLASAPPIDDSARRRIEQLLALPPDRLNAGRSEKRAS
jgi:hypothetical protein